MSQPRNLIINADDLGLENTKVSFDERGFIEVENLGKNYETAAPGTPAAALADEVPATVKKERLFRLQERIAGQAAAISARTASA